MDNQQLTNLFQGYVNSLFLVFEQAVKLVVEFLLTQFFLKEAVQVIVKVNGLVNLYFLQWRDTRVVAFEDFLFHGVFVSLGDTVVRGEAEFYHPQFGFQKVVLQLVGQRAKGLLINVQAVQLLQSGFA